MKKALQEIFEYHETTKHATHRYARSLGYMDWANQPNPFRYYLGTQKIQLPLALEHPTAPYHLLGVKDAIPQAPFLIESLSQLFQFSLGLAAWKSTGTDQWALRCNASSGNLQPTEGYVIMPPMEGIAQHSSLLHYAPKEHALELLTTFETGFWDDLPQGSFIVGLSSILWREAWKYGERSFRYCQLDAGHALKALDISAKMLGWDLKILDILDDQAIDRLLGLDQKQRFYEEEIEIGEMLCLISPDSHSTVDITPLLLDLPHQYEGIVNQLSPHHHSWDILKEIHQATTTKEKSLELSVDYYANKAATFESKDVVLKRRSVQMMDASRSSISYDEFLKLLKSVCVKEPSTAYVNLVLFVHTVEGLQSGLYLFLRNKQDKKGLKEALSDDLLWQAIDDEGALYLLRQDDLRLRAKALSCSQDIAKDSSFSLGMLAHFSKEIIEVGPKHYKELYWECGAIGQQLYLEATSLNLSATGIGCFLDDDFHRYLGLKDNRFQSLYHFTIGRGIIDTRLLTLAPYEHRS